jgi:hypothetical protein
MMPRDFLFGLIRVPMWDYYWGLTAAQVELLTIDQPIVVYKADKENTPWKNGTATASYAEKQLRLWEEKKRLREQEGRKVDIKKAFGQAKRIDFGHFLSTGEKKEL